MPLSEAVCIRIVWYLAHSHPGVTFIKSPHILGLLPSTSFQEGCEFWKSTHCDVTKGTNTSPGLMTALPVKVLIPPTETIWWQLCCCSLPNMWKVQQNISCFWSLNVLLEALNTRQSVLFPEDLPWLLTPIFLFCECEIIQITQYIIHPPKNVFDSHPLSVQAVSRENCFFKKQTNTCNYLFLIFSIIKWYFSQQYGAICFLFFLFFVACLFFFTKTIIV